jgi:hypothetical protein
VPLIDADRRPRSLGLSPLRIAIAATVGCSAFVIITAVAAWATRGVQDVIAAVVLVSDDLPPSLPEEPVLGPSQQQEPTIADTGPPDVLPLSAVLNLEELAHEALSPLTRCGREALRWDKAVGGAVSARVRLQPPNEATLIEHGVTAPMITMCMARMSLTTPTTQIVPATMALRVAGVLDAPAGQVRIQRLWVEPWSD